MYYYSYIFSKGISKHLIRIPKVYERSWNLGRSSLDGWTSHTDLSSLGYVEMKGQKRMGEDENGNDFLNSLGIDPHVDDDVEPCDVDLLLDSSHWAYLDSWYDFQNLCNFDDSRTGMRLP